MTVTILLIAVFQGYWLNKLYHEEEQNIRKTADVIFRESMYKLQADRFRGDTLIFRGPGDNAAFLGEVATVVGRKLDSAKWKHAAKNDTNHPQHTPQARITLSSNISIDNNAPKKPPVIVADSPHHEKKLNKPSPMIVISGYGDSSSNALAQKIARAKLDSILANRKGSISIITSKQTPDGEGGIVFSNREDTINRRNVKRHLGIISKKVLHGKSISVFTDGNDTIIKVNPGFREERDSNRIFVKNFLYSSRSINDSIPIKKIDSSYKANLVKAGITLSFSVKKDTLKKIKRDSPPFLTSKDIITTQVPVGFASPVGYQAELQTPVTFLLKKISPQIGLSLLLLVITTVSFIFIYRNLAAQKKLAVMKDEFISNITHELKTPIATVSVAIEALKNFGVIQSPERTKEYLDISSSELQRLSLLVDKVLKLSMFESKEIEVKKEQFDLALLVDEVMATMKLQFEKNKAVISFKTEGTNFIINADKLHITSIIYNLLDNALKYSKTNPVINVDLLQHEQFIQLTVSDNGIGIPSEYQNKIFDKFFRVPTNDKHNVKGYGLGLSYVAHVIKQHNGSINVESELDKGSTFIVKLPIA